MKIFFDHITGKLTHHDIIYSLALAEFEENEYDYALENGWIPLSWYYTKINKLTWINARTSRLILNKFTFSKKQRKILRKKDIRVEVYDKLDDALFITISDIYKKYIQYKKYYEKDFEEDSEVFEKEDRKSDVQGQKRKRGDNITMKKIRKQQTGPDQQTPATHVKIRQWRSCKHPTKPNIVCHCSKRDASTQH